MKGKEIEASFSGSPEGLSFFRTRTAFPMYDSGIVMMASKGTKSVVIHSLFAVAMLPAIISPFSLSTVMGNEASKYHGPRALPRTVNVLPVTAPGEGRSTTMLSLVALL